MKLTTTLIGAIVGFFIGVGIATYTWGEVQVTPILSILGGVAGFFVNTNSTTLKK